MIRALFKRFVSVLAWCRGEVIAAAKPGRVPHRGPGRLARMRGEVQQRVAVGLLVLSAAGIVTIAGREAFRAQPYVDQAGVVTNGYGNTNQVDPKKSVTPERALLDLLHNANTAANGVRRCVTVKLYPYEFDAYVALAMNVGVGTFCTHSPKPATEPYLVDLINAERYQEACDRILDFNKSRNPKTRVLEFNKGLAKARAKERLRCLGQEVV